MNRLSWIHFAFCIGQEQFDGVFRALALGMIRPSSRLSYTAVNLVPRTNETFCYQIVEYSSPLNSLDQTFALFREVEAGGYSVSLCMMSNDTCKQELDVAVSSCSNSSTPSLLTPFSWLSLLEVYRFGRVGEFASQSVNKSLFAHTVESIRITVNRFLNDRFSLHPGIPPGADCLYDIHNFVGTETIVIPLLSLMAGRPCSYSTAFPSDSAITSYLTHTQGYILPPEVILTLTTDEASESTFNPVVVSNTSSFNDSSGIITLSSAGLFDNRAPELLNTSSCDSVPTAPTLSCEEVPSYLCDSYSGCWIAWGPCQTVSLGYFSPRGTSGQIPCPAIPADQRFIFGDPNSKCLTECILPETYLEHGTCKSIPPGSTRTCDGSVVTCRATDGWLFTTPNSCEGRYLGLILGPAMASPPSAFTMETWIRMETRPLASGGLGNIVPVYGIFGGLFIGIRFVDLDAITIVVFLMSDVIIGVFDSQRTSHWQGSIWHHIAAICTTSFNMQIFLDGTEIGSVNILSANTKSSMTLINSLIAADRSNQLLSYINRVHYGPFRLTNEELTGGGGSDNPLSAYVLKSFPEFTLFDPKISDSSLLFFQLGFFGPSPAGYRQKLSDHPTAPAWMVSLFSCKNVCLGKKFNCAAPCVEGVWDPLRCECIKSSEPVCDPTTITTIAVKDVATGTFSQSTLTDSHATRSVSSSTVKAESTPICISTSSPSSPIPTAQPSSSKVAIIITILLVITVVSMLVWWWISKRRKSAKIAQNSYPVVLQYAPETEWFGDITCTFPNANLYSYLILLFQYTVGFAPQIFFVSATIVSYFCPLRYSW